MPSLRQYVKRSVEFFLARLVKLKLRRTHPTIIGITGSFGKTSTKEAAYEVLKTRWRVRRSGKSLNTEMGLLLAVLEQPSGFRSPAAWIKILAGAVWNAFFSARCDFLVLEYGADKPGDISRLVSAVPPHIGIITHIAAVHQDSGQFGSAEEVFGEKQKLVTHLAKSGMAILNGADSFLKKLRGKLAAKTLWFNGKDLSVSGLENTPHGLRATFHGAGAHVSGEFPIFGAYHVDVLLPGLLCGIMHGVTLAEGIRALGRLRLPPGRMSRIEGKNGSILLDSTYNASPETMQQALELLRDFPGKRKIAVLGNMNELGEFSQAAHRAAAEAIGPWLDQLVTVGVQAALIADEVLKKGFAQSRIKVLFTAREAAEFLLPHLSRDSVVLLKGSQNNVRLERAVKMLMAHPGDAKKLLCRQEPEWEKID